MKIGNRSIIKVIGAVFQKRHWRALFNMMIVYKHFVPVFLRYFFGVGSYPYEVKIKKGQGNSAITAYCHDDILTINEIFCRKDYGDNKTAKIIVDIGSNIGVSAVYFLTRNDSVFCYLYEPVPQNIEKLLSNLKGFAGKYELNKIAVSDENATLKFGVEETGRYGGIGVETGKSINMECRHINDILDGIIEKHGFVDILKIDTEGVEIQTILAIKGEYLKKIGVIYIEANPKMPLLPESEFSQKQYGGVYQMRNRKGGLA